MVFRAPRIAASVGLIAAIALVGPEGAALAQTEGQPVAPPDTEIFLAALSTANGKLTVGAAVNITNSPGYDNQPSFTPDGQSILFTSVRGGGTLPDIYRYDIRTRQTSRVTATPEGEYSPTITPDGRHISVVRIEADGTQRLWRFTLEGRRPELVLAGVKPVGYHAWVDDHTLVLFVLGKPATLQLADTRAGTAEIIASNIGRSLQRIPGGRTISFVERETAAEGNGPPALWIRELDPATKRVTPLVRAVAGATEADCAWTPDGMLLMAQGSALYGWRRGDSDWTRMADLDALGLHGVTRLSVSPRGDYLALVAPPK
jgi:dipeptidyl aminopeptidase/acylaminoacyl peptidase